MQLPEDDEKKNGITPTVAAAILLVAIFIGSVVLLVFLVNDQRKEANKKKEVLQHLTTLESPIIKDDSVIEAGELGDLISGSTLSPDDLDFWDKYPNPEDDPLANVTPEPTKAPELDPSKDGKHTLVKDTKDGGGEEWVLISPSLPKHEYDFTKLVCQSNLMKYFQDGRLVSYVGVDVSKLQGYVDFTKVKKAGIDFVMVRAGARGYGSGQLVEDDYFTENVKRAADAGLNVGVYFFSQAVSEEEALEEANMVLNAISDYHVTYPIAFYMDDIAGDTARIDELSKEEKTVIAKTFMDRVSGEGYIPMLYGDKEWLIKQIDLSKLTDYDIWFSQCQDIPDYPYRFSMWQYDRTGMIDGISGYANLNISFIDFSEK